MSQDDESSQGSIIFDDTLDITMASSYFEQLGQMLNEYKIIILDGTQIERVDGSGLQLLYAFFKNAEALQITVQWKAYSDSLNKSAALSGMSDCLMLKI